jgi:hypothetical protein
VESGKFVMRLPQINSTLSTERAIKGGFGTMQTSIRCDVQTGTPREKFADSDDLESNPIAANKRLSVAVGF